MPRSLSSPFARRASLLALLLAAAPAAVAARPLVVCDDVNEPATLDPQKEFIEKTHTIVQQMFDGLIRFDADGRIRPALAVSWEPAGPNATRFHLRKNVSFHNGEPFDAAAVKFSIERYLNPATGFPALGFVRTISEVRVEDPLTVTVVTAVPDALLLHRLAGFVVMVPPAYVSRDPAGFSRRPVGTGAFAFDRWTAGKNIVLRRNAASWEPDDERVEALEFRFIDKPSQLALLLKGEVDIVTEVPGTETFRIQGSKTARIVKRPTLATVAASFSSESLPLKHKKVRQALNYAVDKEALVRYDLLGNGRPVRSLEMPRDDRPADPRLNPYTYDFARAKALLREAGFGAGFKIRLLEVKATRAAKIIAAHWRRLGVQVETVSTTDAEFPERMKDGPWDIILGYCPDPMHHPFFAHSIFLYSLSPFSLTRDPVADSAIEALLQAGTEEEQRESVDRLVQYVNENALTLFTYQQVKTYGVRDDVEFTPAVSGMPTFRETRIAGGRP